MIYIFTGKNRCGHLEFVQINRSLTGQECFVPACILPLVINNHIKLYV